MGRRLRPPRREAGGELLLWRPLLRPARRESKGAAADSASSEVEHSSSTGVSGEQKRDRDRRAQQQQQQRELVGSSSSTTKTFGVTRPLLLARSSSRVMTTSRGPGCRHSAQRSLPLLSAAAMFSGRAAAGGSACARRRGCQSGSWQISLFLCCFSRENSSRRQDPGLARQRVASAVASVDRWLTNHGATHARPGVRGVRCAAWSWNALLTCGAFTPSFLTPQPLLWGTTASPIDASRFSIPQARQTAEFPRCSYLSPRRRRLTLRAPAATALAMWHHRLHPSIVRASSPPLYTAKLSELAKWSHAPSHRPYASTQGTGTSAILCRCG